MKNNIVERLLYIALAVMVAALLIAAGTLLVILHTNTVRTQQIKQTGEDSAQKIDKLQNHIDCIVSLFTQPNRTNLVITDITNCELTPVNSSAPISSSPPKASQPNPTPNPKPSQSSSSTPSPTQTPSPAPKPSLLQQIITMIGL